MHQDQVNKLKGDLFSRLGAMRRRNPSRCLFSSGCPEGAINAHSVPQSILSLIQQNGHVVQPESRFETEKDKLPELSPKFREQGINDASTGHFACSSHDNLFREIDNPEMALGDAQILNLLMYRATLKELWALLKTNPFDNEATTVVPTLVTQLPDIRLRAMDDLVTRLRKEILGKTNPSFIKHITCTIKTATPTIAASCAGASSDLVEDQINHEILPLNKLYSPGASELNSSWTITVIPKQTEHVAVFSYLAGSSAENFFQHIRGLNGKALAEALSAELILFCENWFLNPTVWKSFPSEKQSAIQAAFDNTDDLRSEKIKYNQVPKNQKWHEFLDIQNRHQLNLFPQ